MKITRLLVLCLSVAFAASPLCAQEKAVIYEASFETESAVPKGWTGPVKVDEATGFKGNRSIVLEKNQETLRQEVKAVSPTFSLSAGMQQIRFATRTEMESMDNSYKGVLAIEFLDAAGKVIENKPLAEPYRKSSWKPAILEVQAPKGTVNARFVANIEKETIGKFWIDELSIQPSTALATDNRIQRLMISADRVGNLLYPEDARKMKIEVWASEELPADQLKVVAQVRDYWGQEQGKPVIVALRKTGEKDGRVEYTGEADLSSVPLEAGRYYELRARIDREGALAYSDFNSFAILPEAPANKYNPADVPFTARNWDNRFPDYIKLTNRLGIRVAGVWGKMEADPAKVEAPQIELVRDLGMGYLTGSPAHAVEQRNAPIDEAKIRDGVRNFFKKYGDIKPAYVNLGNEPHSRGEDVKTDIEAYRIVYDEIKKIDPNIYVVGSSFGTMEEYFKYGAGEWLDAYDFHTYESPEHLRDIVQNLYPALFKKYGHQKPIWSTEIGLNSQGMARQSVAAALYKKFAYFFAGGGANVSWFGILWPDEPGEREESGPQAHNTFFCRYLKYAPKLDAIAYYHAVSGIGIKKFVENKIYGEDVSAFLFRDRDGKSMQLWFKEKGRADVFIPLPGVNAVEVVRIDGSVRTLQAGGKGITLSVDEDPIMLLFDGSSPLPEKLGEAVVHVVNPPASFIRGEEARVEVALGGTPADRVTLTPGSTEWAVTKTEGKDSQGRATAVFSFTIPEDSAASEADLTVSVKDAKGADIGQIYVRPKVAGSVTGTLLPVPATEDGVAAAKFVITNNSSRKQSLDWSMELKGQQVIVDGAMGPVEAPQAYFPEVPSGKIEVDGGKAVEVVVPLEGVDLKAVYRAVARLRDSAGRVAVYERPLAGFYGVPRADSAPKIDGNLDDAAWSKVPVRRLDKASEFYSYERKDGRTPGSWTGPDDLSANMRFLWDDDYLYVAVEVEDDNAGILQEGEQIWYQDGLQFLIDPVRTSAQKVGKYDYALGKGNKGPQAWSYLSADAAAPTGEVKDMKIAIEQPKAGTGTRTYEVAIPWSRLAPFKPEAGANLGLTLLLNEDDGNNRDSYMMWFANASTKDVDTVGDLILLK
jgi:hypothetical protein